MTAEGLMHCIDYISILMHVCDNPIIREEVHTEYERDLVLLFLA